MEQLTRWTDVYTCRHNLIIQKQKRQPAEAGNDTCLYIYTLYQFPRQSLHMQLAA